MYALHVDTDKAETVPAAEGQGLEHDCVADNAGEVRFDELRKEWRPGRDGREN